jgi:hypothetical protein
MTVDLARRHGHYDPRFGVHRHLELIEGGGPPAEEPERTFTVRPPLALVESQGDLSVWEDEGGRAAPPGGGAERAPPALDWDAFVALFGRRGRHDLEAVKAYGAYCATLERDGDGDPGRLTISTRR